MQFLAIAYAFGDAFPMFFFFFGGALIGWLFLVVGFALEGGVAFDAFGFKETFCGGLLHGASGFLVVCAVAEPALFGVSQDIGKNVLQALLGIPRAKLAHPGRIDPPDTVIAKKDLAAGGGVFALFVVRARCMRALRGMGDTGIE